MKSLNYKKKSHNYEKNATFYEKIVHEQSYEIIKKGKIYWNQVAYL